MNSFAKSILKAGAGLIATMVASSAFADAPSYVRVRSINYAGSGCQAGSVATNVASDLQAFTLLFDNYVAQVGPGMPLSEGRKNCQIALDLDFPQGFSYSVLTVDYRGYTQLEPGVTGQQQSAYYFQGNAGQAVLRTTMLGPISRDYQIRDTLGLASVVWSPCGAHRALNINTQVRLLSSNPNARGLITTDSIDGELHQIYALQWRRC